MASDPSGSIPVTGEFGTTDVTDTYAVLDDKLVRGGLHAVADIATRNLITGDRRKFGMLVSVTDGSGTFQLQNIAMGGVSDTLTDNSNWIEFDGGGGTGFVPGSDDGNQLLIGINALSGGFDNVAVIGSNEATADNQLNIQNFDILGTNFYVNQGLNCGIGTSGGGFFANASSATAQISTGGQNTLQINNGTGTQEYALGNYHAAGVNPTGIWFDCDAGLFSMSQDEYIFMAHDTTSRITRMGSVEPTKEGVHIYADDPNNTIGTRGDRLDLNTGSTTIEVWNGATRLINNDVVSRYLTIGEENGGFPNSSYHEFNGGNYQLLRAGNAWFWTDEDTGNPSSGVSGMGDRFGTFNGTTFEVDDNTTQYRFRQAGQGFDLQCTGDNMRVVTQINTVVADFPLTMPSASTDMLRSDPFTGQWNWSDVRTNLIIPARKVIGNSSGSDGTGGLIDFQEQNATAYTETVSWTGTTAPSGTAAHFINWQVFGKRVTGNIMLQYGTAGAGLTAVAMPFPSALPPVALPSGGSPAALNHYWPLNSRLGTALTSNPVNSVGMIRRNTGNTAYEIFISAGSAAYRYAWVSFEYYTT